MFKKIRFIGKKWTNEYNNREAEDIDGQIYIVSWPIDQEDPEDYSIFRKGHEIYGDFEFVEQFEELHETCPYCTRGCSTCLMLEVQSWR